MLPKTNKNKKKNYKKCNKNYENLKWNVYNFKGNRVGYLRTIGLENERVSAHENKHPIGGSYSYLKKKKNFKH